MAASDTDGLGMGGNNKISAPSAKGDEHSGELFGESIALTFQTQDQQGREKLAQDARNSLNPEVLARLKHAEARTKGRDPRLDAVPGHLRTAPQFSRSVQSH